MAERSRRTVAITKAELQQIAYNARMAQAMEQWAQYIDWSARLQAEGVLSDWFVLRAFKRVRRSDFLPPGRVKEAGYDGPIPIGHGQANSQPTVVAMMLEALHPRPGDKILDFGAGSGWTTALMAAVAKRRGRVVGTEIVPELVAFGNRNLAKYRFRNANIIHTPDELGFPDAGPYNKILASARLPEEWLPELFDQLGPDGGRLVAPVSSMEDFDAGNTQDLVVVTRNGSRFRRRLLEQAVAFVPTIREQ